MTYTEVAQMMVSNHQEMQKQAGMQKEALSPLLRGIGRLGKKFRFRKPRYEQQLIIDDNVSPKVFNRDARSVADDAITEHGINLRRRYPEEYKDAPLVPHKARNIYLDRKKTYNPYTYKNKNMMLVGYEKDMGPSRMTPIWKDKEAFTEQATPLYEQWLKSRGK